MFTVGLSKKAKLHFQMNLLRKLLNERYVQGPGARNMDGLVLTIA